MSRTDRDRLKDAREHILSALRAMHELPIEKIWSNRVQRQSLIFDFVVVGEALTNVSPEIKAMSDRIPWRNVADTRNRLVHGYWLQDPGFLGALLRERIPDLLDAVDALIDVVDSDR